MRVRHPIKSAMGSSARGAPQTSSNIASQPSPLGLIILSTLIHENAIVIVGQCYFRSVVSGVFLISGSNV